MKTTSNQSLPRTPEANASFFASPRRDAQPASDTRFRDSLDDRVGRTRPQDDSRRAESEPSGDRSERASNDAQEQRTRAQEADREPAIEREPSDDSAVDVTETGEPTDGGSGEEFAVTETSQSTESAANLAGELIEIKPALTGVQRLGARAVPEQVQSGQVTQGDQQNRVQPDSQPQGDGKQPVNAIAGNPALKLVGTAEGDSQAAKVVPESADSALVINGVPSSRSDDAAQPQQNSNSKDASIAANASLSVAQRGAGTEGESGGNASTYDDAPGFKLPLNDGSQADSNAKTFSLEPTIASANGDAANKGTYGARGPVLATTSVSDTDAVQNERAIASSVSRGLAAAVQQRGGSLTIRLTPATLGTIKIDLELGQGRVAVDLHASTDLAQDALAKNIATLRSSLESKGLTVDRLAVHLTPATTSSGQTNSEQNAGDQTREDAQHDHESSGDQSRGERDPSHEQNGSQQRFDDRFTEAFGLDADDPRAQTLRLRLSAIA